MKKRKLSGLWTSWKVLEIWKLEIKKVYIPRTRTPEFWECSENVLRMFWECSENVLKVSGNYPWCRLRRRAIFLGIFRPFPSKHSGITDFKFVLIQILFWVERSCCLILLTFYAPYLELLDLFFPFLETLGSFAPGNSNVELLRVFLPTLEILCPEIPRVEMN